MTKTITLPISTETCDKIKKIIGLTLWILATVGMVVVTIGLYFNWWNNYNTDRFTIGLLSSIGSVVSIGFFLVYAHDNGVWINIKCNCEANK